MARRGSLRRIGSRIRKTEWVRLSVCRVVAGCSGRSPQLAVHALSASTALCGLAQRPYLGFVASRFHRMPQVPLRLQDQPSAGPSSVRPLRPETLSRARGTPSEAFARVGRGTVGRHHGRSSVIVGARRTVTHHVSGSLSAVRASGELRRSYELRNGATELSRGDADRGANA